jgi:hypothetical protein
VICASEIKRKDNKALKERSEIKIAEMRIIIIIIVVVLIKLRLFSNGFKKR